MRIHITRIPPVSKSHGMKVGRVCEVIATKPGKGALPTGWWVMGDMGRPVLVLLYEAVVLPEE